MDMRCPKCGFNQPKETYCVQCGIHIEKYQKKTSVLILNFLKHPFFHLSVFFSCVFILIYVVDIKIPLFEFSSSYEANKDLFHLEVLDVNLPESKKRAKKLKASQSLSIKEKETPLEKTVLESGIFYIQSKISFLEITEVLESEFISDFKKINSSNSLKIFSTPLQISQFPSSESFVLQESVKNTASDQSMSIYFPEENPLFSIRFKWKKLTDQMLEFEMFIVDSQLDQTYSENIKIPLNQNLILTDFISSTGIKSFLADSLSDPKNTKIALFLNLSRSQ